MNIQNTKILEHVFLQDMYQDSYFPKHLVDQVKIILLDLCAEIEVKKPEHLEDLYELTLRATQKINDLQDAFDETESEIETVARDCIGMNVYYIAQSYGFVDADAEELISARDW